MLNEVKHLARMSARLCWYSPEAGGAGASRKAESFDPAF